MNRSICAALITGSAFLLFAAGASAATVTFSTNGINTGFNGGTNNSLSSSSGAGATLAYIDDINKTVNVPSNVNYGNFTLACGSCSNTAGGSGAVFGAFTFNLMITDVTDNATGVFQATSTGGTIFSDSSSINLVWSPIQLGPGAAGAATGNFGTTLFQIIGTTRIVNPTSGAAPGQTTVQGNVDSTAAPEPATLGIVGAALLGLGTIGRKRFSRS